MCGPSAHRLCGNIYTGFPFQTAAAFTLLMLASVLCLLRVSRQYSVCLVCVQHRSNVSVILCMRRVFRYAQRLSICTVCGEYRADCDLNNGADTCCQDLDFSLFYYISVLEYYLGLLGLRSDKCVSSLWFTKVFLL